MLVNVITMWCEREVIDKNIIKKKLVYSILINLNGMTKYCMLIITDL